MWAETTTSGRSHRQDEANETTGTTTPVEERLIKARPPESLLRLGGVVATHVGLAPSRPLGHMDSDLTRRSRLQVNDSVGHVS